MKLIHKEVNPNSCPFCGAEHIEVVVDNAEYSLGIADEDAIVHFKVVCHKCGASSAWCHTRRDAISRWNRRAEVKTNENS